MNKNEFDPNLHSIIEALASGNSEIDRALPNNTTPPSVEMIKKIIQLVKTIIFPGYFNDRYIHQEILTYHIGANVDLLQSLLKAQIVRSFHFANVNCDVNCEKCAASKAAEFIARLPRLKHLLHCDVEAIFNNDPAVENFSEVIFCYPVVTAMLNFRVAHELLYLGVPVIPRMMTELAHSATGIDIHPGAQIGEYFGIDHGTGVVIGETCIIGNHVTIYQGVTLGAKNFSLDSKGHPINIPRHPIIEDNVTIYSNATVLGRITIGKGSIIGGNVWLTGSVPPGSRILQHKAVVETYSDGAGI